MPQKSISILIPDGEGDLGMKVLRSLSKIPNLKIYIQSREKWPPIRLSRHHAGFFIHTVDGFDRNRLDSILQLANRLKPDIILPVDHPTIRLISAHREEVQAIAALPPLPTPESMDIASNKWRLTDILAKENIPFPKTVFFQNENRKEHDFTKFTYPVLTKPLDNAGGTGILFFDNPKDLEGYLYNEDHPKELIIQSFVRGYDLGCSVLCQDGKIIAYTIQKGIIPGDKRFEPPSSIEFIQQEQVIKNIKKLMRALNWSGVANIDHRYDEDTHEPKILEINPRYWGSVLGSVVAGINFPFIACQIAMKRDFPEPKYNLIRYTKPEKAVKLLLKKYFKGDNTVETIKNTGLPYTITDLGPEFIKYAAKLIERFSNQ